MTLASLPPESTGVITIDLAALRANWRALAKFVEPAECGAVVKANAYGLGASEIIPALSQAGCRTFFVATADEAREARALAPGAALYVLDGLLPGSAAALLDADARPVLSSLDEAREWASLEGSPPAALHVDTGLNRLGLGEAELRALTGEAALLARLDLRLVMSHLACADEPDHPMNAAQLAAFDAVGAALPAVPASLAASDGLMLGPAYHLDLVRPGYALYGGQASKGRTAPVSPVVAVKARVLQVRDIETQGTVGYSATYNCGPGCRIAVVAAGYADGFFRKASGTNKAIGGVVGVKGRAAQVAGRVSMDLITIDVSGLDGVTVERGDWVDLIGPALSSKRVLLGGERADLASERLTLEEFGWRAGTIGYEVLTRLGTRFKRVYLDAKDETA